MPADGFLDYIEIPAPDIPATKRFYGEAFGWTFTDYGPDYVEFDSSGRKGGFNAGRKEVSGGVLIVLYAADLDAMELKVNDCGRGDHRAPLLPRRAALSFPRSERQRARDVVR